MKSICVNCVCRYVCKLASPTLVTCPIFKDDVPEEKSEYEQPYFSWDEPEDYDMGGRT